MECAQYKIDCQERNRSDTTMPEKADDEVKQVCDNVGEKSQNQEHNYQGGNKPDP
jgi:hypothetical protein